MPSSYPRHPDAIIGTDVDAWDMPSTEALFIAHHIMKELWNTYDAITVQWNWMWLALEWLVRGW